MPRYSIVLADDHVMLRQGLRKIVESVSGINVVGEAGDGFQLLDLVKRLSPDMAIIDISMPKLRGIEAISEIKSLHPGLKVIVLTMHKSREYLHHSIAAGADGYLLKEDADQDLFAAIEAVRSGKLYLSPELAGQMPEEWAQLCRGKFAAPIETLSNREREVLKLICEGKTSKEVGEQLFISTRTVEHHRARIMKKLGKKNIAELMQYALQKGYV